MELDDSSTNTFEMMNLKFSTTLSVKKRSFSAKLPHPYQVWHNRQAVVKLGTHVRRHKLHKVVSISSNSSEKVLNTIGNMQSLIRQVKEKRRTRTRPGSHRESHKSSEKKGKSGKRSKKENVPSSESEAEGKNVEQEQETEEPDPNRYPPQMNLLILGETGVGKSTFINGLVNYLKYESMEEALENGPEILIKSAFTLTDDDFNDCDVVSWPTIGAENNHISNEKHGKGQSSTQEPKSYVFTWKSADGQKSIRIIDTPGIGDTRGIEQDKQNFDKILSFIADFSEIHAICILVKPNTSRLTLAFRFCIDELLVHLHRSASRNIVFCFTNTRGTLYKPGDTLPTLKEHLARLQDNRGIDIPLDMSTLFSFDNESFRFLCARKSGISFDECETENFSASWQKSVQESLRLFSRISELPVHCVNETLCLNNTRSVILSLARPLAEIARNQLVNMQLIEDKMKEVADHVKSGKSLRDKLYVDQLVLHAGELDYPQTVCTADGCVERRRFGTNPNAPLQIVYSTVCHDKCYVKGVQTEICPNAKLLDCEAIMDENCLECKCRWQTHLHIRYKLTETLEKVLDPSVEASLKSNDQLVQTIEIFLANERKKVDELRRESDKISSYCVEFAAFLAHNSILPYNDSYRQYIDHLIRMEHDNVAAGGSDLLLKDMQRYKQEYEQQVQVLNSRMGSASGEYSSRSVEEMNRMVEELRNMQHCGSVITEIEKLETLKVRETQAYFGQTIQLDNQNSWFGGGRKRKRNRKRTGK